MRKLEFFHECDWGGATLKPYPGDSSKFLLHGFAAYGDLALQACGPSIAKDLARALEREIEFMVEEA